MPRPRPASAALRILGLAAILTLALGPATTLADVHVPGAPDCPIFPSTNVWNRRVDKLPVRSDSQRLKRTIGLEAHLHP
ncbi:MAG: hypothetical protein ABIZ34_09515, partial [Candidatus Limnocylindrales bacterium]